MKLLFNAIRCNSCHDRIVSTHRHDYKMCSCKKVGVDGGLAYSRRIGNKEDWVEECAYIYDAKSSIQKEFAGKFIVFSPGGKSNPSVAFDLQADAELSAKDLANRTGFNDWYVAQLVAIQ